MKIKRLEHVAIAVKDLEAAKRVLQDTLGLTMEYEEHLPQSDTTLAMYPIRETYVELLHTTQAGSRIDRWIAAHGEGLFHLCFEVEDIDAALAELRAKGVALLDETPRRGHGGSRIAFLDPRSTGNFLVELAELPANGHGEGAPAT